MILGILIVKSIIWAVSLGSGTSGGVLAPLLMMGGALGGARGAWSCPAEGAGFWPLVSMGAILGGTMRSPFTGIVFALELTHDVNMLLPLLVAVTHRARLHRADAAALDPHREGQPPRLHLSREYAIDPLEILFVREVMRTQHRRAARWTRRRARSPRSLRGDARRRPQRLYPVVDDAQRLVGVVTRNDLQALVADRGDTHARRGRAGAGDARGTPTVAYPDEPLRVVVHRMAETGLTRFPVVERGSRPAARHGRALRPPGGAAANLEAERRRERVLPRRRRRRVSEVEPVRATGST